MQEAKKITVTLKDEEKKTTHDFLIYEDVVALSDDAVIVKCIEEAKKSFDGQPDSIKVKIMLEVL